jgi:hypothetical protein
MLMLAVLLGGRPWALASAPATPAPAPTDGGSFAALLRLMPAMPLDNIGSLRFSDYARQRAAFGLTDRPTTDAEADHLQAALAGLARSEGGDLSAPEWKQAFGFDLWDVDQLLEFLGEDVSITVLRGRFDARTLTEAWERAGYQPRPAGSATYYSAGEDGESDFLDPVAMLHFGHYNNLALLDPDTIIASATRQGAEDAARVHAGHGSSMADDPAIGTMSAAVPPELVTADIVDGQWLWPPSDLAILGNNPNVPAETRATLATQVAELEGDLPRMPPIVAVLAGATAGGPLATRPGGTPIAAPAGTPATRAVVVAVTADAEAAATAADVAEDRLATQAPLGTQYSAYADLFTEWTVQAMSGQPAVLIELAPAPGAPATIARDLLVAQNLTFLFWIP